MHIHEGVWVVCTYLWRGLIRRMKYNWGQSTSAQAPADWSLRVSSSSIFLLSFSRSDMSNSLQPHGLQHARLSCPSLSPGVCSNMDMSPLSHWCHPTISSSVTPFFCLQSFPAPGSFPICQLFASGGQSIKALDSASVLPMNIHSWFPLGLTGLLSLLSKGLSRVFSSTTV